MEMKAGGDVKSCFCTDQTLHGGMLRNYNDGRGNENGGIEEMILREMEKKRIRDEMVASWEAFLRRRELENEVLREMMTVEREIAKRRSSSVFDSGGVSYLNVFGIGIGEGCLGLVNRTDGGVFDAFTCHPHQELTTGSGSGSGSGVAVTPLSKGPPLSLSPDEPANLTCAGKKRKSETTIVASNSDGIALGSKVQKSQEEWSCDLCQVKANSEQVFKDHLNGKKHKAKEKASLPKAVTTANLDESHPSLPHKSKSIHSEPFQDLEEKTNCESLVVVAQVKENKVDSKIDGSNFKYWCTVCNFGAPTLALMTEHRMGKEHSSLLRKKGGGVVAINTMPDGEPAKNVHQ